MTNWDTFYDEININNSYILGWIAAKGSINSTHLTVFHKAENSHLFNTPFKQVAKDLYSFDINSRKFVSDVNKLLQCKGGYLDLPDIETRFQWKFLHGMFKACGGVNVQNKICYITSNSIPLMEQIETFCKSFGFVCVIEDFKLVFKGKHCLDFLDKILP
jgi:hypothetical protein